MGFKVKIFGAVVLVYAALAFAVNVMGMFPGIPLAREVFNPLDIIVTPHLPVSLSWVIAPMLPFLWSGFWASIAVLVLIFG